MSHRAVQVMAALAVGVSLAACSHPAKAPTPTPAATHPSATRSGGSMGSAAPTPMPSSASASATTADEADCSWHNETQPTQFSIPARDITEPILSLPLDGGNVPAPPHDQRYSVAWWNGSPQVGSDQGHVILTAHTWTGGEALGNVLADPARGLNPGDIIKVFDAAGPVCYRYTHMESIDVATYNPASTHWINPNGPAQLTIMICWDPNPTTGEWRQRHVFFADPVR